MLMRVDSVNGHEDCTLEDTDYVKENWDVMSAEEKRGWFEALENTFTPVADDVLDNIIDSLDSWEYYYDGMEDVVASLVVTEENRSKLQDVLNEIFCKDDCRSYSKGRSIDV